MTECKFCDDKPERCVCSTPPKKKSWVEFDKDSLETHPEAYRTCHIVSDTIEWESEELAYWDGNLWLLKDRNYSISIDSGFKWHYVTFPPKPEPEECPDCDGRGGFNSNTGGYLGPDICGKCEGSGMIAPERP